jgi:hypothetical protein
MPRRRKGMSATQVDRSVSKWRQQARRAIAFVAMALAALYGLSLSKVIPLAPVLNGIDATTSLHIEIVFYYFFWVWGVTHDTDLQEAVYAIAPEGGKLRPSDIGVIVLIFVVAILLIWSVGSQRRFAGLLTVFFVVNIFAWRWLLSLIKPVIAKSSNIYIESGDNGLFSLERLNAFVEYISGRWQWLRFLAMGLVLVLLNTVTFFDAFRQLVSNFLEQRYPAVTSGQFSNVLPVALFALFIVVSEAWIWMMRMRTDLLLNAISNLEQKYKISRR